LDALLRLLRNFCAFCVRESGIPGASVLIAGA
jgi:hypothetical protein